MAFSRRDEFSAKDVLLSEWCKALSHPARLAILKNLANRGECICGDLVIDLPLAQSTVSQHLKALKEVGLVKGIVDGPRSRYCIDKRNFDRFGKMMSEFSLKLTKQLNELSC